MLVTGSMVSGDGKCKHVRGCKVIKKIFREGKKIIILVTMKIFLYTNLKKKRIEKNLNYTFLDLCQIYSINK